MPNTFRPGDCVVFPINGDDMKTGVVISQKFRVVSVVADDDGVVYESPAWETYLTGFKEFQFPED